MPSEASAVLSRRALLAGIGLGGLAAFLAACSPAPSPSGSPSPSAPPSESASPPSAPSASSSVPPSPPPAPSITPSPPPVDQLAHRIAGLLIVGFRGTRLADAPWLRTAITRDGLGGGILFDRDQLTGGTRNVAS